MLRDKKYPFFVMRFHYFVDYSDHLKSGMRRKFFADSPLVLGVSNSNVAIPSRLKHTSCCWFETEGLFSSPHYNFDRICAAGTREGYIIIYGLSKGIIDPICLLCGHINPITDVRALSSHVFISVSRKGVLCAWSTFDGSCISSLNLETRQHDYQLSNDPVNDKYIWCWRRGGQIILADMENSEVIFSEGIAGLRSFGHTDAGILAVCVDEVILYHLENNSLVKIKSFPIPEDCLQCFASRYGFVSYYTDKIELCDTENTYSFPFHNEEKSIITFQWFEPNLAYITCADGSIILIRVGNECKLEIVNPNYPCLLIDAECDEKVGYAFITSKFDLCLYVDGNLAVYKYKSRPNKIYAVPDPTQSIYLETIKPNGFIVTSWSTQSKNYIIRETPSRITTLSATPIGKNLTYTAGCADGAVFFFSGNDPEPVCCTQALTSPVTGIVQLEIPSLGSNATLVLGADGSCALLKRTEVFMRYPSSGFEITSIYILNAQELIIIGRSNGSFTVQNIIDQEPAEILSTVPEGAVELYPRLWNRLSQTHFATVSITAGNSSVLYSTLALNGIEPAFNSHYTHESVEKQLSLIFDMLMPMDRSKSYSSFAMHLPLLEPPNCDMTNLANDMSFALVGDHSIPSLFYPKHRLLGGQMFSMSPDTSAIYAVGLEVIADLLNKDIGASRPSTQHLLRYILSLAVTSDKKVKSSAVMLAARITAIINEQLVMEKVTEALPLMPVDKMPLPDIFFVGIAIVTAPYSIPKENHRLILEKLLHMSLENTTEATLALIIIIDGFDYWASLYTSKQSLMTALFSRMLKYPRDINVTHLFAAVCGHNVQCFFVVFDRFVTDQEDNLSPSLAITRLLGLATAIAMASPQVIGSLASLAIANVGSTYPRLAQLSKDALKEHAEKFKTVDMSERFILVGTSDGKAHVFKHGNHVYSVLLFQSPIAFVSISPDERHGVAISREEAEAKVFTLKGTGFIAKKPKVEPGISVKALAFDWESVKL